MRPTGGRSNRRKIRRNIWKDCRKPTGAVASPFRTAEAFGIEDIIDPRDTRRLLCEWVEMAYDVEKSNLGPKKRGMRC